MSKEFIMQETDKLAAENGSLTAQTKWLTCEIQEWAQARTRHEAIDEAFDAVCCLIKFPNVLKEKATLLGVGDSLVQLSRWLGEVDALSFIQAYSRWHDKQTARGREPVSLMQLSAMLVVLHGTLSPVYKLISPVYKLKLK